MNALASHYRRKRACLTLLIALPALGSCAAKLPKLPLCDGKHRRDANPYGTVLPGAAPKAPAAPLPPTDTAPGDPTPSVPNTSAITPTTSYPSC